MYYFVNSLQTHVVVDLSVTRYDFSTHDYFLWGRWWWVENFVLCYYEHKIVMMGLKTHVTMNRKLLFTFSASFKCLTVKSNC